MLAWKRLLEKATEEGRIDRELNLVKISFPSNCDLGSLVIMVTNWKPAWHGCQVIYSQFGLAIHQNDHQARRRFVEWAQNEIAVIPNFHKRILFSDEAHFWLNGYVNKQNCRIWSEANQSTSVCRNTVTSRKTDCLVRFMGCWNLSSKTMKATTLKSMVIGIEP
ncbi:uncharacterized protein TNCV_1070401 [Trichonephila clavipes]|nr:uncharacterized protein TNCV_1070401 [Trichonephila clavipes]